MNDMDLLLFGGSLQKKYPSLKAQFRSKSQRNSGGANPESQVVPHKSSIVKYKLLC